MTSAYNALRHSVDRIVNSKVIVDPFPHLEIDNIFPESFYKILLARVPSHKMFLPEKEGVFRMNIISDPCGGIDQTTIFESRAQEKEKIFWDSFQISYFGDEFITALLNKFETFPEEDVYMCGRLIIDRLNAGFGPHTDRYDKVISLIFHIPSAPINEHGFETMLFKPKDPNFEDTGEHYTYDDFDEVKRISYHPNKLFCFKVMSNTGGIGSWHSYHQDTDLDRLTIKAFIQRDIDSDEVRRVVDETKHRSKRWRDEKNLNSY